MFIVRCGLSTKYCSNKLKSLHWRRHYSKILRFNCWPLSEHGQHDATCNLFNTVKRYVTLQIYVVSTTLCFSHHNVYGSKR